MAEAACRRLARWALGMGLALLGGSALAWSVQDDTGRRLELAQSPQRIVSVLPALTEMVCQLGRCERLVGVDRYANWPERVRSLPRVGGGMDPQIEAIAALRPDLVLMAPSARGAERLRGLGLPVLELEPKTHADVERIQATLGQVLQADAPRAWQDITAQLEAAARALPPAARGWRVYFEVNDGPYAASESSFIGQTLAVLGLANVVPGSLGPFPRLNPERVVRADPDLLLLADAAADPPARRPGWSGLKAVREGRVCSFTPEEADILVRPGPRMGEAARLMVRCVARHVPGGRP